MSPSPAPRERVASKSEPGEGFAARLLRGATPEPLGGNGGAVGQGLELGPDDVLGDELEAREGAEAAIGAADHPLAIADHIDGSTEPVRHQLRMLEIVRGDVDDAGN